MAFRVFVHRATDFRSVVLKVTSRGRAKQRCTANSALDTEEVVRDVNRFSRQIRLKALKTKLKSSLQICSLLRQIAEARVDSWPGDQDYEASPTPGVTGERLELLLHPPEFCLVFVRLLLSKLFILIAIPRETVRITALISALIQVQCTAECAAGRGFQPMESGF